MLRSGFTLISWLPVFLWMGVIFIFSTDLGSLHTSSRFLGPILDLFLPWVGPETRFGIQIAIRKCCHFGEYAVLTLLIWRALIAQSGVPFREWRLQPAILAFILASLYAGTDEFHQAFVADRSASLKDVMIDSTGAAAGAAFARLCWYCSRRLGRRQKEN